MGLRRRPVDRDPAVCCSVLAARRSCLVTNRPRPPNQGAKSAPAPKPSPLQLPNELLLQILESINSISGLASMCLGNRFLRSAAQPALFREAASRDSSHIENPQNITPDAYTQPVVLWAAERGRLDVLQLYCRFNGRAHLASLFRVPANACQPHWPWDRGDRRLAAGFATALHLASQKGHNDTVLWLLQQGVDVHRPSYHTCQCPSRHLQLLVERGMTDPSDAPSATPLALALAHGHETTARVLIVSGAHWVDDDIPEDVDGDDGGHGPCLLTESILSGRPPQYVSSLCIMAANGMHSLISWLGDIEPGTLLRAASIYDMQDFNALHYVVCIEQKKHLVGTKEKVPTISTKDMEVNITATVEALLSTGFDPDAKVAHCYHEEIGDRLCDDGGCTVSAYDLACERKQYGLATTLRSCWHQTSPPIVPR